MEALTKGIDISVWQGSNVDFNKLKSSGTDFVIIRAGYGSDISQKDRQFENNYSKAKAAGMPIGAYWYSYATNRDEAIREAETCIAVLKGKQFEYPIYYDVEDTSQCSLSKKERTDLAVAFLETLEKAGYFVGLYSFLSWLLHEFEYDRISKYTIWLAQWASRPTYDKKFDMWQYGLDTAEGAGDVDSDHCYRDFPTEIKNAKLNGYGEGTTTNDNTENKDTPTKSVTEIAQEVIRGDWGNGEERKTRLTEAGYDYDTVQAEVDRILNDTPEPEPTKSVTEIAQEVIRGDWGNGEDRKNRLTEAGYDYDAVQAEVDRILSTTTSKKSNEEIAKEVVLGMWGNGEERKTRLTEAGYNYTEIQNIVNKVNKK